MQELSYKIIHRNHKTGIYTVALSDGRRMKDNLAWVKFRPQVGDTGKIRQIVERNKMIPDSYDPE